MRARFKPLGEQVIVVTGASSGPGLSVARKAAEAGAALLLTSADEPAVRKLAEEINAAGGRAHAVAADLSDPEACARVGRAAIARFGGFDTWINAGGDEAACANGVREAAAQLRAGARSGVLVHMAERALDADVRRGLRSYGRAVNLSHIALPKGLKNYEVAAAAALYAAIAPVSRMAVNAKGKLSGFTQARRRQGLIAGVGVLALAGIAIWAGRKSLSGAARPHLVRVVRPLVIEAARRRPLQAAKLVAKHPRQALKLAASLR
ncbi:MAG: short-chain dehydrogenase/reductase [Phenylobacterium sp.]|nr:short-chain dehydrogenase/reductase [Phenylobacterium sp.]